MAKFKPGLKPDGTQKKDPARQGRSQWPKAGRSRARRQAARLRARS